MDCEPLYEITDVNKALDYLKKYSWGDMLRGKHAPLIEKCVKERKMRMGT